MYVLASFLVRFVSYEGGEKAKSRLGDIVSSSVLASSCKWINFDVDTR